MTADRLSRAHPNAFVPHDLDGPIMGACEGPLSGLTCAVKDMYDIAGHRTGGGSPAWLAAQLPAIRTSPVLETLLSAGASIVGKTVCDEFFYSLTGVSAHYGAPPNPRAPGRITGGSSSGSASAVAAGRCDFALGSDTGGSVRIPAALCGLYGIRPTHGTIPLEDAMAMAPSFDTAGWLAATPGVFKKVGQALLRGGPRGIPVTTALLLEDAFAECDPRLATLTREAAHRLGAGPVAIDSAWLAPGALERWREAFRVIQAFETWETYGGFIRRVNPALGPGVRERFMFASMVSAADALRAREVQEEARAFMEALVAPGRIVVAPTAPSIAPHVDASASDLDEFRLRTMRLTCIAGLVGLPQVTIPAGALDGCPIGLSLIGAKGTDLNLIDLAWGHAKRCWVGLH